MTSQAPVEKTRSVPGGDALPEPHTERADAATQGSITARRGPVDPPTVALTLGVDDAAVHGVDEVLGREVRLVTLPPASGDVLSERIEQVRHLARLHHPHLLEVYDVDGLAPDTESTLVLENVAGEPLPLVLREGPIGEPAVARMGAQLASALAHAHAHGVEHGAIGAASILVDRAHTDAWLVGLTASLSGPLPVVDPEADGDDGGAARRRASDVRALAAVLAEIVEHTAATTGGDDPAAVTRPTAREGDDPASPLAALLREADSPEPPSAARFSDQLARVGRGVPAHEVVAEPTRLVPVVASWPESPATGDPVSPEPVVPAALAAGPAVRAKGAGGVTPVTVIGPAGRRARRAGVLGAATATLALASGLVIWAGESHPVRPEAQAEIGAPAPSSIAPPPLVPRVDDAGSLPAGGGGGTWTGGSDGFDRAAVGVASPKEALREEPSPVAVVSTETASPRSTSAPESSIPDPVVPSTRTRPTPVPPTSTPRTTTTPVTTPPTTNTTTPATTTAAPTTTTAAPTTTTAKATSSKATSTATSSTATSTTVAPTTTPSEQAVLAAGQ